MLVCLIAIHCKISAPFWQKLSYFCSIPVLSTTIGSISTHILPLCQTCWDAFALFSISLTIIYQMTEREIELCANRSKIWANKAYFERLVNICSFPPSIFALPCRFVINMNMFYEFCSSKEPIREEWSDKVHTTVRTAIKYKFYQNNQ